MVPVLRLLLLLSVPVNAFFSSPEHLIVDDILFVRVCVYSQSVLFQRACFDGFIHYKLPWGLYYFL